MSEPTNQPIQMQVPASIADFLMDHYGLFDVIELNMMSLYVLKTMAHMERDGFKFALYRKVDERAESYQLDIHELIAKFRIGLSEAIAQQSQYDPVSKIERKESNEKDSV